MKTFLVISSLLLLYSCTSPDVVSPSSTTSPTIKLGSQSLSFKEGKNTSSFLGVGYIHTVDISGDDFMQVLIYEPSISKELQFITYDLENSDVSGYLILKGGGIQNILVFDTGTIKIKKSSTNNYTFIFDVIVTDGKKLTGSFTIPISNV